MHKRLIITSLVLGILAVCLLPEGLEAVQQVDKFGGMELNTHSNDLKKFIFGPFMRIVAIVAAGSAIIGSMIKASPQPLLVFGAIAIIACLLPTFIDKVFTMVLP